MDEVIPELTSPITSSVSARLLQSSPRNGGIHFEPVSTEVLPPVTQNSAILSLNWIDLNGDNALDLFYGSFFSTGAKVLINSGYPDYTYSDESSDWIPPGHLVNIWGSSFADLDNDGLPDLIAASSVSSQRLAVFKNHGSGQGFVFAESYLHPTSPVSVSTGDLDLNGFVDIVAVPYLGGETPSLLLNGIEEEGMAFNNHPGTLDMAVGYRTALNVHDWGKDGDLDLYMGHKPEAFGGEDHFFYLNGQDEGTSEPSTDKIVRVCVGAGGSGAVGAKVSVQASTDGPVRTAYVRTSDGRGSQTSRILVFGVPDNSSGMVTGTVTWPDGNETTHQFAVGGTLNFIKQDFTSPLVFTPITAGRTVGPDGSELEFECISSKPLADFEVELNVSRAGNECDCGVNTDVLIL